MEARGKQDLWIRQKPELLAVLREIAIIQSAESSNRIEGVTVPPGRLRPLVIGRERPRDRSEAEVAGYRRALEWIFSRKRRVIMRPAIIQHLHRLARGGAPDAGVLKARNNEIIEVLPSGEHRVRFQPTSARETPAMLRRLCAEYERIVGNDSLPPLLAIGTFIFDLLCIHPFRDSNGRVARLATSLLLQRENFVVGRFVSLERHVEERKEDYYRVLGQCSAGWHEGKNEIGPWWNFILAIVRAAYREFEQRIESASSSGAKSLLVERAILAQPDDFTLSDVASKVPSASEQLVKKVLASLKGTGRVQLVGRGRGARWRVID